MSLGTALTSALVPEALAQAQTHPQTQDQQQQDKHPKAKGAAAGAAIGALLPRTLPQVTAKVDFQGASRLPLLRNAPTDNYRGVGHLGAVVVRWSIGECDQKPILKSYIEPALQMIGFIGFSACSSRRRPL